MSELIEQAITEFYGERCDDYLAECVVCKAWKEYDDLVALADRATWTSITKLKHDLKHKKEQA